MSRSSRKAPWAECNYCKKTEFTNAQQFVKHLRREHCSQEGGSFVCHYGENNVCYSLPVEGVNDIDYEKHVYQQHTLAMSFQSHSSQRRSSQQLSDEKQGAYNSDKFTVYSASQFLPAVLSDPNKGKQRDFFTKTWGDGFTEQTDIPEPNYLPHVTISNFEYYLRKLGKKHKKHMRLNAVSPKPSGPVELLQNFPHLRLGKYSERARVDIQAIPKIFLNPLFDLSNVDTFNTVYPHVSNSTNPFSNTDKLSEPSAKNSAKLLQEKLTHYLDIVEVQIAQQVAQKSDAFFHAMTSHDVLMDQLGQNVILVKALREKIQKLDKDLVKSALMIIKSERSRCNNWQVYKKLRLMSTVMQTQPTIQLLLSSPDYVGALDLIHTTQDLLSHELAGILSFRHLSSELSEMLKVIDTLMAEELERYSTKDLNRPYNTSEPETYDTDKLSCILLGLVRRGDLSFVEVYKREVCAAVKAGVKQGVIEVVASSHRTADSHKADSSLDDQLKALSVTEWVSLMSNVVHIITLLLRRIQHVYKVMIRTVNICAGVVESQHDSTLISETSDWQLSEAAHEAGVEKITSLLVYSCEYSQDRLAQLLACRTLINQEDKLRDDYRNMAGSWLADRANLSQLKELSSHVDKFTEECQVLCPQRSSNSLKNAFSIQATKFMNRFHSEKVQKLSLILDTEPWKQTDVPASFQQLVDHISEKGKFSVNKNDSENVQPDGSPKTANYLVIGDEKYAVVGTVLMLVDIVSEYCVHGVELKGEGLLRHLSELLVQFNARCYRLMLAGEAVSERTGLRKITSTNLALLLRALQLVLWLIPHVNLHFQNILEDSHKNYLEGVSNKIKEHARDVNAKLLEIMQNLIVAELRYWEPKPPVPSKSVQAISKHLRKFHEAISNVLPHNQIQELYKGVNKIYKESLSDKLQKYNITNDGGPQHGLVTSEILFYLEELKRLKAVPPDNLELASMNDIWTLKANR